MNKSYINENINDLLNFWNYNLEDFNFKENKLKKFITKFFILIILFSYIFNIKFNRIQKFSKEIRLDEYLNKGENEFNNLISQNLSEEV